MCSACTTARTGRRFLVLLCVSSTCISQCISVYHYLNISFVDLGRHESHFEDCVMKAYLMARAAQRCTLFYFILFNM